MSSEGMIGLEWCGVVHTAEIGSVDVLYWMAKIEYSGVCRIVYSRYTIIQAYTGCLSFPSDAGKAGRLYGGTSC
jgi:hypothetical protein